jgi:hypothetical protein
VGFLWDLDFQPAQAGFVLSIAVNLFARELRGMSLRHPATRQLKLHLRRAQNPTFVGFPWDLGFQPAKAGGQLECISRSS